jgi:hypothetical protein
VKKLLYILLLLPTLVFGQSGDGYVNYKSYKTHYGNGSNSTYNGYTYSGLAGSATELQAMLDVNHPGTSLTHQGEVLANSNEGFKGGRPFRWANDYYGVYHYGWFQAQETGTYRFSLQSDDGSALWVDGDLKLFRPCCGTSFVDVSLTSGQWYYFETKWQEYQGGDYMFLKYSPPSNANFFYVGDQTSYLKVTNIEPIEEPIDPSVDFQFEFNSNMEPDKIKFGVYYDASTEQNGSDWLNTSTTNSTYYLDSDGTKDVTDYLNLVKMSDGKKATTTGGSVEWCVVYDYDTTNKRYRVGIDKREFPSGFTFTDLKQLKLFDLWDGEITYMSDDAYWANYYIYTDTQFDFTSSTFSSYIRDANGFYGMRAEFSFEDVEIYKKHRLLFVHAQDLWNPQLFIDDYVTVGDVVSAFSELSGGGINGGYKGDLNGVQLQNADVNQDGNFDFQDTFKLLKFLQGEENLTTYQRTSDIMRVIPKSEYDGTTTSNWKTQPNKGIKSGVDFELIYDSIQTPQYKVTFLGDINFSHSPTQTGTSPATQSTISSRMMSVRNSSTQKNTSLEVDLDIEKTNENIVVTLNIPENNLNIIGSEFRIRFDNERVSYDRIETTSNLNNFDVQRTDYIKLGSISTDGSLNLNGGVEYKIYFSPQQTFDSILGLISVTKSELVTKDGTIIESVIK